MAVLRSAIDVVALFLRLTLRISILLQISFIGFTIYVLNARERERAARDRRDKKKSNKTRNNTVYKIESVCWKCLHRKEIQRRVERERAWHEIRNEISWCNAYVLHNIGGGWPRRVVRAWAWLKQTYTFRAHAYKREQTMDKRTYITNNNNYELHRAMRNTKIKKNGERENKEKQNLPLNIPVVASMTYHPWRTRQRKKNRRKKYGN